MIDGSWSVLTITSSPSIPNSLINAQTRATTNFQVLFDGTAVDNVLLVFLSRTTRMVIVLPGSPSSPMNA